MLLLALSPLSLWLCIAKILQSSMADCGNKLTMAIELNLPWFFSWRKGRILNRREYGFVTLQTNFIFENTKTWQKPLFSLPLKCHFIWISIFELRRRFKFWFKSCTINWQNDNANHGALNQNNENFFNYQVFSLSFPYFEWIGYLQIFRRFRDLINKWMESHPQPGSRLAWLADVVITLPLSRMREYFLNKTRSLAQPPARS